MSKQDNKTEEEGITRRELLGGSAKLAAIAGAGGLTGMGLMAPQAATAASKAK